MVIDDYEFFLAQNKEGNYSLLSSLCPHSWGTIFHEDNCFMCPTHGWRFEVSEGICINGPTANMYSFEVAARHSVSSEQPNGYCLRSVPLLHGMVTLTTHSTSKNS